jgi:hypothetical protein
MELDDREAVLRRLEERLLRPEVRTSADDVANLLAADFIEFGRSGMVYGRQQIIDALCEEQPATRAMSDFSVRWLSEEVALVTYRSSRIDPDSAKPLHSLRSSIWRMIDGRWQMVFHQGTPTKDGDGLQNRA